jgi:predicted dehydrogenase
MVDVRFGLIGTGRAAASFASAIRRAPGALLLGVSGSAPERARAFAAEHQIRAVHANADSLLASADVDAVIIAAPHHLHAPLARSALHAGKHVVIEKPMTLTLESADAVIAQAAAAKLVLAPIAQMRFSSGAAILRETIASGRIGRVLTVRASVRLRRSAAYYDAAPWRKSPETAGGGVLIMNAIHVADLLVWALGPVASVSAKMSARALKLPVEDSAVLALAFESGALGTLEATVAVDRESKNVIEVQGDKGRIRMTGALVDKLREGRHGDPRPLLRSVVQTVRSRQDPLVAQMRNIVDAILGRSPLVVDPSSARSVLSLILGAYESNATGRSVSLT